MLCCYSFPCHSSAGLSYSPLDFSECHQGMHSCSGSARSRPVAQPVFPSSSRKHWFFFLNLILSVVRDGGKNLPRNASTNSVHVSIEPYGNDSYHVAAISLKEKGKRCSFITSGLTQFSLTVFTDRPICAM